MLEERYRNLRGILVKSSLIKGRWWNLKHNVIGEAFKGNAKGTSEEHLKKRSALKSWENV